jgi:hypothetical protein
VPIGRPGGEGGPGVVRRGDDVTGISRRREGDEVDRRSRMAVTCEREKASLPECTNSKERCFLANAPRLLRPNGLSTDTMAGGVKRAGSSEAGLAGLDPRRKFRRDLIFEIQINLDFGKTLRNSTRRFRRNLDMGNFPNFF